MLEIAPLDSRVSDLDYLIIKYLLQEAYVDGYKEGYNAALEEIEKAKG